MTLEGLAVATLRRVLREEHADLGPSALPCPSDYAAQCRILGAAFDGYAIPSRLKIEHIWGSLHQWLLPSAEAAFQQAPKDRAKRREAVLHLALRDFSRHDGILDALDEIDAQPIASEQQIERDIDSVIEMHDRRETAWLLERIAQGLRLGHYTAEQATKRAGRGIR